MYNAISITFSVYVFCFFVHVFFVFMFLSYGQLLVLDESITVLVSSWHNWNCTVCIIL